MTGTFGLKIDPTKAHRLFAQKPNAATMEFKLTTADDDDLALDRIHSDIALDIDFKYIPKYASHQ